MIFRLVGNVLSMWTPCKVVAKARFQFYGPFCVFLTQCIQNGFQIIVITLKMPILIVERLMYIPAAIALPVFVYEFKFFFKNFWFDMKWDRKSSSKYLWYVFFLFFFLQFSVILHYLSQSQCDLRIYCSRFSNQDYLVVLLSFFLFNLTFTKLHSS